MHTVTLLNDNISRIQITPKICYTFVKNLKNLHKILQIPEEILEIFENLTQSLKSPLEILQHLKKSLGKFF